MKKATSRDVAKFAGVSQSTVSFVLNNKPDVIISEETRKKVLEAANELNYTFSTYARSRKPKYSNIIGIMAQSLFNPFVITLIQYIEQYASEQGYTTIICDTRRNMEKEKSDLSILESAGVSGIIYTFNPKCIPEVTEYAKKIPCMIIGEKNITHNITTVGINGFRSGQLVMEHLIELGHRNFAYITTRISDVTLTRSRRLEGVKSSLKEHGFENNLIIKEGPLEYDFAETTYELEIGRRLTHELLDNHSPTAIICANDMVAFGAIDEIIDRKLSVPNDISVCGLDNSYLSNLAQHKLTTVNLFPAHRSKMAVDILLSSITNSQTNVYKIEYEPELIIRNSTGPAPLSKK